MLDKLIQKKGGNKKQTKQKTTECINSLHKSSEERGNISMSTELSFDIRRRVNDNSSV